jgi:hypothetical protein
VTVRLNPDECWRYPSREFAVLEDSANL